MENVNTLVIKNAEAGGMKKFIVKKIKTSAKAINGTIKEYLIKTRYILPLSTSGLKCEDSLLFK